MSKYGLSRIFKVLLDLISIKTLLLFARRPLSRFIGAGAVMMALTILTAIAAVTGFGAGQSGSVMVYTTVALLLGSFTVFLVMLGAVANLVHRRSGDMELKWITDEQA
ncbi:MAG: hypothetical protein AAF360_20145 [Pseudomonadota bacterium]